MTEDKAYSVLSLASVASASCDFVLMLRKRKKKKKSYLRKTKVQRHRFFLSGRIFLLAFPYFFSFRTFRNATSLCQTKKVKKLQKKESKGKPKHAQNESSYNKKRERTAKCNIPPYLYKKSSTTKRGKNGNEFV